MISRKKKKLYFRRTGRVSNVDGNMRLVNTNPCPLLRRSFPTLSRCLPTFPLYLSSFLSLPLALFTSHRHLWFLYKVSHSTQTKIRFIGGATTFISCLSRSRCCNSASTLRIASIVSRPIYDFDDFTESVENGTPLVYWWFLLGTSKRKIFL